MPEHQWKQNEATLPHVNGATSWWEICAKCGAERIRHARADGTYDFDEGKSSGECVVDVKIPEPGDGIVHQSPEYLTLMEAAKTIRHAGNNIHPTSQWMQMWAAWGMNPEKWPKPDAQPPGDEALWVRVKGPTNFPSTSGRYLVTRSHSGIVPCVTVADFDDDNTMWSISQAINERTSVFIDITNEVVGWTHLPEALFP